MQELSADGLSSLCRLCGEVGECFDLFDDQEQGAEILDKIQRSIGIAIKESDGLPNGICNGCHEKLLNFCCFFDQCHDTQERLQEFISIQSAIKYEACDEDEIDSQAVGDEDCGDDQDNNYFFVEIEGDEAPDYCTEPEAETQSATKTATEVMEVEEEHDLSDAQFLTVPAEDNAETCERESPVKLEPTPIIIENMDGIETSDINAIGVNVPVQNSQLPAERPKKKQFVYLVKNASHIPVASVLSAVFSDSPSQSAVEEHSLMPSKLSLQNKRKPINREIVSSTDKASQQVVIKGSDGKENMIFLDVPMPVKVVSSDVPDDSEEIDDPTWPPRNTEKAVARSPTWSKLKRARTAVRNSVKTLRLPKPLKKREIRERTTKTLPRKQQTQIPENDPNYAIMMEKFSKPVSISTMKRHGLYKSRPNGYKINAPYKKDVAPYIEKVSDTEYRCKICLSAKFRWNYKAEIHILEHLDWRPFECDVCGRAFTQNQYLTKHKRLHFPDDTNFMCEVCGKGFQRRYYLTYHMDEHFDRTYTCEECGRKFSRRQKHDEHVRYHHKCHYSVCDICGQTLRTTALSRHKKQHGEKNHSRKKKETSGNPGSSQASWLTCTICGRAFRSLRERDEHEAEHSNSLLPFRCEECDVYFKSKRTLNNHMLQQSHSCVVEEGNQIISEVISGEEECDVASRVLDELSSTIVVSIPMDL